MNAYELELEDLTKLVNTYKTITTSRMTELYNSYCLRDFKNGGEYMKIYKQRMFLNKYMEQMKRISSSIKNEFFRINKIQKSKNYPKNTGLENLFNESENAYERWKEKKSADKRTIKTWEMC